MHELRRLAYLEALGIDCYESRRPLPGAAPSRRRLLVGRPHVNRPASAETQPVAPQTAISAVRASAVADASPGAAAGAARVRDAVVPPVPHQPVPRFSLVTVIAGDWLWLEELGDMPLTAEQVQLLQAMALALRRCRGVAAPAASVATRPEVLRFDWPMHNNPQLDSSEQAARTGATAFINRRLEQYRCRGLVLLGHGCVERVLPDAIDAVMVSTASSAEILQNPSLKPQVWRDLLPLLSAS